MKSRLLNTLFSGGGGGGGSNNNTAAQHTRQNQQQHSRRQQQHESAGDDFDEQLDDELDEGLMSDDDLDAMERDYASAHAAAAPGGPGHAGSAASGGSAAPQSSHQPLPHHQIHHHPQHHHHLLHPQQHDDDGKKGLHRSPSGASSSSGAGLSRGGAANLHASGSTLSLSSPTRLRIHQQHAAALVASVRKEINGCPDLLDDGSGSAHPTRVFVMKSDFLELNLNGQFKSYTRLFLFSDILIVTRRKLWGATEKAVKFDALISLSTATVVPYNGICAGKAFKVASIAGDIVRIFQHASEPEVDKWIERISHEHDNLLLPTGGAMPVPPSGTQQLGLATGHSGSSSNSSLASINSAGSGNTRISSTSSTSSTSTSTTATTSSGSGSSSNSGHNLVSATLSGLARRINPSKHSQTETANVRESVVRDQQPQVTTRKRASSVGSASAALAKQESSQSAAAVPDPSLALHRTNSGDSNNNTDPTLAMRHPVPTRRTSLATEYVGSSTFSAHPAAARRTSLTSPEHVIPMSVSISPSPPAVAPTAVAPLGFPKQSAAALRLQEKMDRYMSKRNTPSPLSESPTASIAEIPALEVALPSPVDKTAPALLPTATAGVSPNLRTGRNAKPRVPLSFVGLSGVSSMAPPSIPAPAAPASPSAEGVARGQSSSLPSTPSLRLSEAEVPQIAVSAVASPATATATAAGESGRPRLSPVPMHKRLMAVNSDSLLELASDQQRARALLLTSFEQTIAAHVGDALRSMDSSSLLDAATMICAAVDQFVATTTDWMADVLRQDDSRSSDAQLTPTLAPVDNPDAPASLIPTTSSNIVQPPDVASPRPLVRIASSSSTASMESSLSSSAPNRWSGANSPVLAGTSRSAEGRGFPRARTPTVSRRVWAAQKSALLRASKEISTLARSWAHDISTTEREFHLRRRASRHVRELRRSSRDSSSFHLISQALSSGGDSDASILGSHAGNVANEAKHLSDTSSTLPVLQLKQRAPSPPAATVKAVNPTSSAERESTSIEQRLNDSVVSDDLLDELESRSSSDSDEEEEEDLHSDSEGSADDDDDETVHVETSTNSRVRSTLTERCKELMIAAQTHVEFFQVAFGISSPREMRALSGASTPTNEAARSLQARSSGSFQTHLSPALTGHNVLPSQHVWRGASPLSRLGRRSNSTTDLLHLLNADLTSSITSSPLPLAPDTFFASPPVSRSESPVPTLVDPTPSAAPDPLLSSAADAAETGPSAIPRDVLRPSGRSNSESGFWGTSKAESPVVIRRLPPYALRRRRSSELILTTKVASTTADRPLSSEYALGMFPAPLGNQKPLAAVTSSESPAPKQGSPIQTLQQQQQQDSPAASPATPVATGSSPSMRSRKSSRPAALDFSSISSQHDTDDSATVTATETLTSSFSALPASAPAAAATTATRDGEQQQPSVDARVEAAADDTAKLFAPFEHQYSAEGLPRDFSLEYSLDHPIVSDSSSDLAQSRSSSVSLYSVSSVSSEADSPRHRRSEPVLSLRSRASPSSDSLASSESIERTLLAGFKASRVLGMTTPNKATRDTSTGHEPHADHSVELSDSKSGKRRGHQRYHSEGIKAIKLERKQSNKLPASASAVEEGALSSGKAARLSRLFTASPNLTHSASNASSSSLFSRFKHRLRLDESASDVPKAFSYSNLQSPTAHSGALASPASYQQLASSLAAGATPPRDNSNSKKSSAQSLPLATNSTGLARSQSHQAIRVSQQPSGDSSGNVPMSRYFLSAPSSSASVLLPYTTGILLPALAFADDGSEFDIVKMQSSLVARQLCLMDADLLSRITFSECMSLGWTHKDKMEKSPNVMAMIDRFNHIALLVTSEILRREDAERRAATIAKFVSIAENVAKLGNFNSLKAVLTGLQCTPIYRLKRTWAVVSQRKRKTFQDLSELMSEEANHSRYREELQRLHSKGQPCVPYLGIFLTDLIYTEQFFDNVPQSSSASTVSGSTSLTSLSATNASLPVGATARPKEQRMAATIESFQHFQRIGYAFPPIPEIQALFLNTPHNSEEVNYSASLAREPKESAKPKPPVVVPDADELDQLDLDALKLRLEALDRELSRRLADMDNPAADSNDMWELTRLLTQHRRRLKKLERASKAAARAPDDQAAALDALGAAQETHLSTLPDEVSRSSSMHSFLSEDSFMLTHSPSSLSNSVSEERASRTSSTAGGNVSGMTWYNVDSASSDDAPRPAAALHRLPTFTITKSESMDTDNALLRDLSDASTSSASEAIRGMHALEPDEMNAAANSISAPSSVVATRRVARSQQRPYSVGTELSPYSRILTVPAASLSGRTSPNSAADEEGEGTPVNEDSSQPTSASSSRAASPPPTAAHMLRSRSNSAISTDSTDV